MADRFHHDDKKMTEIETNLNSVIRSVALIMFGHNNLFGYDRFISSPTGRWGMAKLVSSRSQLLFVLQRRDATFTA